MPTSVIGAGNRGAPKNGERREERDWAHACRWACGSSLFHGASPHSLCVQPLLNSLLDPIDSSNAHAGPPSRRVRSTPCPTSDMSPFHSPDEIFEPAHPRRARAVARFALIPGSFATLSMQTKTTQILLFILTAAAACAQYTPPSPAAPVPGAIDDFVKAEDPTLKG